MSTQNPIRPIMRGFGTFRLFPQDRLEQVRLESRQRQIEHRRKLRRLHRAPTMTTTNHNRGSDNSGN